MIVFEITTYGNFAGGVVVGARRPLAPVDGIYRPWGCVVAVLRVLRGFVVLLGSGIEGQVREDLISAGANVGQAQRRVGRWAEWGVGNITAAGRRVFALVWSV